MLLLPYNIEALNALLINTSYRVLHVYLHLSDLFHVFQGSGGGSAKCRSVTYLVLPAHLPPCLLFLAVIRTGGMITGSVSIPVKKSFLLNVYKYEKIGKRAELLHIDHSGAIYT